eukprot:gnl/MRDRNA2_/MRDRNA2_14999_c0_seq1.p1 gnl/MRDRNA2_/MRDRNA2_14999_c0~~gnl/MRDRNA2_/MRDRNA2_14999_c0_seq1.p1  ORF type:complete len:296 (+),score=39.01 gnl/MRDRNA2_/MRDRNA2_14999_c0_seq1:95-982(+)
MPLLSLESGLEIFVDDIGPRDGKPLILLHGYTDWRGCWRQCSEILIEQGYRCVLPDMRGVGDSTPLESAKDFGSLWDIALDVLGVADALGIEKFDFVGHSLGGGVGLCLAYSYRHRLHRIVVACPIPVDGLGVMEGRMYLELKRSRRHFNNLESYTRSSIDESMHPERYDWDEYIEACRVELECSLGHLEGAIDAMVDFSITAEQLASISTEMLVLSAASDPLLHSNLLLFFALSPGIASLHVVHQSGHQVIREQHVEIAATIEHFLMHGPQVNRPRDKYELTKKGFFESDCCIM